MDFNRDWAATPHWDAVAAIKQMIVGTAADNPMRLVVDTHDPSTKDSPGNRMGVYAYRSTTTATRIAALRAFLGEYSAAAGFTCAEVDDSASENSSVFFDNFVKNSFGANEVAVTLEHGWVEDPSGALWTTTSYRTSGANWGRAISRYLF